MIWRLWPVLLMTVCSPALPDRETPAAICEDWSPARLGTLEPEELDEASGLAASRLHDGVFFTHNDSGGTPEVFAILTTGELVGRWTVSGVVNRDWEAVATGPCPKSDGACLYIGDTGDNLVVQETVQIVVVREPEELASTKPLDPVAVLDVRYDEGPRDVEAFIVDRAGDVYFIEKFGMGIEHGVWRVPSEAFDESEVTAERVATLVLSSQGDTFVTDADLHPTEPWLLVRTYFGVQLFTGTSTLDMFERESFFIEGGGYGFESQGEAIAWSADGTTFLTTSEGKHAPVSEWSCE